MSVSYRGPVASLFYRLLLWPLEAVLLLLLLSFLAALPSRTSSSVMAFLFRSVGPLTAWHRRSYHHLSFAMPQLSEDDKAQILNGMWNNLGRTIGEYMHLKKMLKSGDIQFRGTEHLSGCDGGLIVSAHMANWEALSMIGRHLKIKTGLIYRPLNNPHANKALKRRARITGAEIFEKGRPASLGMLRMLRSGGFMLMLTDQQLREGISVPFFGHPAQTAISHIKLAQKQNKPIFLAHISRLNKTTIDIEISPALRFNPAHSEDTQIMHMATEINLEIERWITQNPENWLWPHRRWGKTLPQRSTQHSGR